MKFPRVIFNDLARTNASSLRLFPVIGSEKEEWTKDGDDQLLVLLSVCREEKRLQMSCKCHS